MSGRETARCHTGPRESSTPTRLLQEVGPGLLGVAASCTSWDLLLSSTRAFLQAPTIAGDAALTVGGVPGRQGGGGGGGSGGLASVAADARAMRRPVSATRGCIFTAAEATREAHRLGKPSGARLSRRLPRQAGFSWRFPPCAGQNKGAQGRATTTARERLGILYIHCTAWWLPTEPNQCGRQGCPQVGRRALLRPVVPSCLARGCGDNRAGASRDPGPS